MLHCFQISGENKIVKNQDMSPTLTEADLLSVRIPREWKAKKTKISAKKHRMGRLDDLTFFALVQGLDKNALGDILKAVKSRKPTKSFIGLAKSSLGICYVCGEKIEFETNGLVIRAKKSCEYPNGIPLVFELNIPSGVMIVANDLRPDFDFEGDFNINTAMGRVKTTKAMEAIGCAHAYVGNSCPSVYKTGKDKFVIASSGYDEENDKEIKIKGKCVANICTDLWWYSIVDSDEFKKRGCEGKYTADKVNVKPGVYRFTHFYGTGQKFEKENKKPTIYSEIERIRPPEPAKYYKRTYPVTPKVAKKK